MTADPCAHSDMGLWLEGVGTFRVGCHDCGAKRELGWSEAVRMLLTRDDAALRARAKQAEQERDEAVVQANLRRLDEHARLTGEIEELRLENADLRFTEARYDRLREAAREVVRLYRSEEIDGDTGDGCHALRKLAEEIDETTQKPAGEGGPSEGGR